MKRLYNFRKSMIALAVICAGFLLYSLLIKQVNKYLTYASIFLLGIFLTLIFNSIFQNNIMKRTNWLENRLKLWNSISYKVKLMVKNHLVICLLV